MGRERLEIEFGHYSEWLVDAAVALAVDDRVPVACRGTGDPGLFARLAAGLKLTGGEKVLDVGCGIGGPMAWLARERAVDVVGVDVMEPTVKGLGRLFPSLSAVVATSRALPFRTGVFDAAWIIGALEMIGHKREALAEISRVLAPGGRLAVYTLVASCRVSDSPRADRFEEPDHLLQEMRGAGFEVARAGGSALPSPPERWTELSEAVHEEVGRVHSADPGLALVRGELVKLGRLLREKTIFPWEFILHKEEP
ncbi:MAG: class I SAM-dependent methyltransferase [Actinomycetota bacterium]